MRDSPIGVVLVNWNSVDDTLAAVQSVWNATPRPRRVVVVDNGSADDSVARLESWRAVAPERAGWLSVLSLPRNEGFAGGNNRGLELLARECSCSGYLLLNNDAVVAPDYFAVLDRAMTARPDAGLLTGTIYEWDRRTVWYAGGREIPWRALVLHDTTVPPTDALRETAFVCACTMLIPAHILDRIGLLPEVYFPIYWDDAEYSCRARDVGPLVYVPAAVAYHKVGASVGLPDLTPRVAYIQNHHRALFVRRNYRGARRAGALAYLAVTKPARFVKEILRGNPRVGWAILCGAFGGMRAATGPALRPAIGTAPDSAR